MLKYTKGHIAHTKFPQIDNLDKTNSLAQWVKKQAIRSGLVIKSANDQKRHVGG